jgi:glycosyltransferase involved in cell wall biosynthesis
MTRLSVLVVAHNEERQLADCLARLRFADEIVVVLDRCSDGSRAIAEKAGARLVEGGWDLEGPRRNAGIAACSGDWILEIDADERVSPELAAEIRTRASANGYFLVPVLNYIGGKPVTYGWGAYNGVSAKPILFAKGSKTWGAGRVHPQITLGVARGCLTQHLDHFVDRDLSDMFQRLNRYTTLAAQDAVAAGTEFPRRKTLRRIFSRGWKSYVARRGYREGHNGVALALFSSLYPLLIHLKVVALRKDMGK